MHQRITHRGAGKAYPIFGLNASKQYGVLTLTARCADTEATAYVAVMPFAPTGSLNTDQTITCGEPVGTPTVALNVVSEGGLCIDGIDVRDMAYVYVGEPSVPQEDFIIDVSFTPVVTMVVEVK